ncbi:MAG TPA: PilW family protein [Rubrivivax sp.]|nr:PilW family protein [Rubrivivax sp.]
MRDRHPPLPPAHASAAGAVRRRGSEHHAAGFTIIELLVAVVIGLTLTLAVTGMMTRHERDRRSVASTNDVALGSASVSYLLDRTIRSAGSGFAQSWEQSTGCLLRVSRSGTLILPRANAFPAPFNSLPQTPRLMPLLVHAGAGVGGTDVIAVLSGASALGEAPLRILPNSAAGNALRVGSTVGLRGNDVILVLEEGVGCVVQQIAAPFTGGDTQLINTGGVYANDPVDTLPMASFSTGTSLTGAQVAVLGNTTGNLPQFQLLGIGANNTLFSYDLLRLDGTDAAVPVAEGLLDLRALYGVDSDNNGLVDSWVSPSATGWTAAELSAGTAAAATQLRQILALRVGMVLRTDRYEKDNVSPDTLTLFADLPTAVQYPRTLSSDERRLRTRAVEFTVPLRNTMFVAR